MALKERLNDDMKAAMKGGDKARLEVLRYLLSLVQNAEKEKFAKQPGAPLADDETIAVLQKEAKRRKDALELFRQGNRDDLVKKEEAELAVMNEYLPKGLSEAELEAIVDGLRAKGFNDFNSLMRETMKLAKGRTDGRTAGDVIKKKLGG